MFMEYAPETMGHKFIGESVNAPEGSAFLPGDMVVRDPRVICGACIACKSSRQVISLKQTEQLMRSN